MARRLLLALVALIHLVIAPPPSLNRPDLVNHHTSASDRFQRASHAEQSYAIDLDNEDTAEDDLKNFQLETLENESHESLNQQEQQLEDIINERRCHKAGIEDKHARAKRYVTNEYKWLFTNLRWKLRDPYHLFKKEGDFETVRQTLAHALDMWSRASDGQLTFDDVTDSNATADLDMFFARWDHGDHEPFDGKGGIVAHSGYPMEGKVHFDASELWTINGKNGIDLRYVTLHELGHALGLRHSEEKGAIMHPIYRRADHRLALAEDDIDGIRALYHSADSQQGL